MFMHEGAYLDAELFNREWCLLYGETIEGICGVFVNEKHHVRVELTCEKRDTAVETIISKYTSFKPDDFKMVDRVVRDTKVGANETSMLIRAGRENCTAWRWTPVGGVVGYRRLIGARADPDDYVVTMHELEMELANERTANSALLAAKDREIAKLQKESGGGDANDADTVSRRRFERMKAEYMAKNKEVEGLKAQIAAKDKEITATKESAEDGIRLQAMDAYWRKECSRLNAEVESLKSARADSVVARGECEALRAQVGRFERTAMEYVHCDVREVDKIANLKEAYITLALKAGQYQKTGAEERVTALQAEVKALQAQVRAGRQAAERDTLAYCAELEAQNRALVEASGDSDADARMALLRREVDDGKVLEAALRGQVKEAEARIALVTAEMQTRVTKAEAMEAMAREVLAWAGGVDNVTGRVHGELAHRYNKPGVSREDFEEWMQIHNSPVFQLGMDFAGIYARDADVEKNRALAEVEKVKNERAQAVRQLHEVRGRCERAEIAEARARRLLATYAGERARLVVAGAKPEWEVGCGICGVCYLVVLTTFTAGAGARDRGGDARGGVGVRGAGGGGAGAGGEARVVRGAVGEVRVARHGVPPPRAAHERGGQRARVPDEVPAGAGEGGGEEVMLWWGV